MKLRLILSVAAFALVAACGSSHPVEAASDAAPTPTVIPSDPETPPASPDAIPAIIEEDRIAQSEPVSIEIESDEITASANIDGFITDFAPNLSARIKSDVEMALDKAQKIAAEEAGEDYFMPHDYQYDYIKTASVGDVISIEFMEMFYTGGAHPNYMIGGILHDRASGEDIPAPQLLSESGKTAMKALLMDELAKEKLKRMGMGPDDLALVRGDVDDIFPQDVEFWFGQVTLVPAIGEDKFGGLVVHYSPYEVGAYAEGSYDILVSAVQLGGMLAEPYAGMFGGEPDYEEAEEY